MVAPGVTEDEVRLRLAGCPDCTGTGFSLDQPAILYYLKISQPDKDPLYKIGITNKTVEYRFRSKRDLEKITTLKTWYYSRGEIARGMEQSVLTDFSKDRYQGVRVLETGNTESAYFKLWNLDRPNGTLTL